MIDNKKMWESILSEMLKDDLGLADYIIIALRQQGLKWNDDTKEIVSIEPECIIEEGRMIMDDSKKAIQNIKQALRQLATNGVPVGNMIEAMKELYKYC